MAELLKNYFNLEFVSHLADCIAKEYPGFDKSGFQQKVFDKHWEQKELKQRMRHITTCLGSHLPDSYTNTLDILTKVAPEFRGLPAMIFPDFVEVYGLQEEDQSLKGLEWFTQFSSSEFAIRPFIKQNPERVMKKMLEWASHENHHVRRLASEGCRPRLPWAMALPDFKKNPEAIIPILEKLKADSSEYVRRSVANNLNDIAKDHPELVLQIGSKWKGVNPHTDWIIKHAFRSLLKKGSVAALANFDFERPENIELSNFTISTSTICIGDGCEFGFDITNTNDKPLKLRLEFGIDYVKANGKTSRKIFHITENSFAQGKTISFSKSHSFKNLTTRKHYPGKHKLVIIVNGKEMNELEFTLLNNT